MITHLPSHCKFQKMWQKLAGPASYNLASLTWEKRLWLQGEKDTPKWERPAIIMIIIIISKAETNQTVHRSLWSSPGSFLRSPLPLSKRRHELEHDTKTKLLKSKSKTHMCFSTSSLSVCKARRHSPLKNGLNQRLSSEPAGWSVYWQQNIWLKCYSMKKKEKTVYL